MNLPLVVGLTGGIATGKSTCCQHLVRLFPETVVFNADACVHQLYQNDEVIAALLGYFGDEVLLPDGSVNKPWLRGKLFASEGDLHRQFVEALIHPKVRQECLALRGKTIKTSASRLFVAEVPLLFENGFDFGQSANLLVATSRKTQIQRLKKRNAWDDDTVASVLAAQLPIDEKLTMADVVFWNEGHTMPQQCLRFLREIEPLLASE